MEGVRKPASRKDKHKPFFGSVKVVPCKVLLWMYKGKPQEDGKNLHALVHPCDFRSDQFHEENDTTLIEVWHKSYMPKRFPFLDNERVTELPFSSIRPAIQFVSIEAIEGPCYVVEEMPGLKESFQDHVIARQNERNRDAFRTVFLIRDREQWGNLFTFQLNEMSNHY